VLVSALTTSFFTNVTADPAVPDDMVVAAEVQLTSGVPFVSDADVRTGLEELGIDADTTEAIVDSNAAARIDGLRSALAVLALITLVALVTARWLPTVQPSDPRFAEAVRSGRTPDRDQPAG
jgi:hypothetical protein